VSKCKSNARVGFGWKTWTGIKGDEAVLAATLNRGKRLQATYPHGSPIHGMVGAVLTASLSLSTPPRAAPARAACRAPIALTARRQDQAAS
jgi:hypothetical protein